MQDIEKSLQQFLICLDEKRFYDAHEALEDIWFPKRFEQNNETLLLKGFINASVSFELKKRGKYLSSLKVWNNYLKYRPLLYKIDSKHLNSYHYVARYIENLNSGFSKGSEK